MCLFSNRSQMTSKCGKNKKVVHQVQLSVSLKKTYPPIETPMAKIGDSG